MLHSTYCRAGFGGTPTADSRIAVPCPSDRNALRNLPRNPIIADVCFRGGYIDAWGRGTIKIIDTCKQAVLPDPEMKEIDCGFIVTLFKDNMTLEQLAKLGLNDRQVKAVFLVKERGRITNKEYQEVFVVARITTTRDLKELVDLVIFKSSDTKGAGSYYEF